ncbi:low-density lipoprotein receptor-related protein 6-like [Stylophora pistillata]|uniref:low-density lipoprotein receptor-related protein 6-like n=1 Tax=Stylophora pistillata TaxID=50429 RepID=UPI000C03C092|nr:low-density lipoprotein receptor-related protein 6-like [Stylophora pistillata]
MDGNNRSTLVKRGIYSPNGLTLDGANNRLYWVDARFHVLEYYDLERHTIKTLLRNSYVLRNPFGLTSLEDDIYWTDSSSGVVYQSQKDFPSKVTALVRGLSRPLDIHAYDRTRTIPDHPCSLSFGGCSHLCLMRPKGYKCACPDNLKLSKDGKTCIPPTYIFQKFLLFADDWDTKIYIVDLDDSNFLAKALPIGGFYYEPYALGMDITDNRVYWTGVYQNSIRRAFINGTSPEVVVSVNVRNPAGLAVDPVGGNIYWSDTYTKKIEVSRMDGTMRKVLIDKDLDKPMDIILDLTKGLIYWCDWGTVPKIETANMDGNSRRMLVKRGLDQPSGLTLDEANNRLYWVDAYFNILEYYDLERHTITTVTQDSSKLGYPFGLTFLEDHWYWTDRVHDVVRRAEKKTLSNIKVVVRGLDRPRNIYAYDRNKPLPDHPCSKSYGGCSHLCLLRPDGYRCSCPDYLRHGENCSTSVHLHSPPSLSTPQATTLQTTRQTTRQQTTNEPPATTLETTRRTTRQQTTNKPPATTLQTTRETTKQPTTNKPHGSTLFTTTQLSSTRHQSNPTSPTDCRSNKCRNGGFCVIPGYFCECPKYYVWDLCLVYVGSSAVEVELNLQNEKQWIPYNFQAAVAKACTNSFCGNEECESTSRQDSHSEKEKKFVASDAKILGLSFGGENTLKVGVAVLFPSLEGQVPEPLPRATLEQILQKNEGSLGEAIGGTIIRIGKRQVENPKNRERSSQDKETFNVPIVAGLGGTVVVLLFILAFFVYQMKRKRNYTGKMTDDIILDSDLVPPRVSLITKFENPAYIAECPMHESTHHSGGSVTSRQEQVNGVGSLKNNKKTEKAPERTFMSNPTYGVPFTEDPAIIEDSEIRNATIEQKKAEP